MQYDVVIRSSGFGRAAIVLGSVVLLGWTFSIPALVQIMPGWSAMQPFTALAFLFGGLVLQLEKRQGPQRTVLVALLLLAASALFQYISGLNLGTDLLLFPESVSTQPTYRVPGRMGEMTAVAFLLFGTSCLLPYGRRSQQKVIHWVATLGLLLALVSLVGYLFGSRGLTRMFGYSMMAAHTATGFICLFVGILLSRPRQGWFKLLLSNTTGGDLFRRLTPIVIIWPLAAGLAANLLEVIGGVDPRLTVSSLLVAVILGQMWMIFSFGKRLNQADLQRLEAERKVLELNARLEQRVEERTAELMAANRELEAFTFATSHDLKGPLGRINSFSTLLEKNYGERLDGDGLLFLGIIRQNAIRLGQLVEDLLSHARVSQKALELQEMEVSSAVEAIVQEKVGEIQNTRAEVTLKVPSHSILGDPHAFSQALGNLVENALKYSSGSPLPVIEIGGKCNDDRFLLWVRDNGIGFKMEYHDKVFQMFQRLHTYTEYTGSGVGLALVKRAMERMGGKVWAQSSPGQGATFFLEFKQAG